MRVAGVGVDLVDIARMRRVLARTPRFVQRVFTDAERAWCGRRADPVASYAGCFAAREAVLKALGVGFSDGVSYDDVSVDHDEKGRPVAVLTGAARRIAREQGVTEVFISISHTREVAVANAVASTPDSVPPRPSRAGEKDQIARQFKQARSLLDDLGTGRGA